MKQYIAVAALLLIAVAFAGCTAAPQPVVKSDQPVKANSTTSPSISQRYSTPAPADTTGTQHLAVGALIQRLTAAGIKARSTGQLPMPLFGAQSVEGIRIEDTDASVSVFADAAAAAQALATASNPQANTVSWVAEPHFVLHGNLLLITVVQDPGLISRVAAALK